MPPPPEEVVAAAWVAAPAAGAPLEFELEFELLPHPATASTAAPAITASGSGDLRTSLLLFD
jgi:hypothetical protein